MEGLSEISTDVRVGLTAVPKQLPARLFYDAEGSSLFEQITRLPEYYLTRTELQIFEHHAADIVAASGPTQSVVELGAGSAFKTRVLLQAMLKRAPDVHFYPVDVSPKAVELAVHSLREAFPSLTVLPLVGRYRDTFPQLSELPAPRLVLFIGSSIGNYDLDEAVALLRNLRSRLSSGDALLLGTDLQKDPALLVPAYDDRAGVTARFNLNVLARINRELGGHFDLTSFRHLALWNAAASRMEMHLESTREQDVSIDALDLQVHFSQGERIHTESSYKYTTEMVNQVLSKSGFQAERQWTDARGWFAVHLARTAAD